MPCNPTHTHDHPMKLRITTLALLIALLAGLAGTPAGSAAQRPPVASQLYMTDVADRTPDRWQPVAIAPDQGVVRCTQALADPSVSLPAGDSPWREERAARSFVSDPVFSSPQSLRFIEDTDSLVGPGGDLDSAGQEVALPANLSALAGSLRYQVAAGSASAGDQLRVEIYRPGQLNDSGRLAIFTLNTADVDDGTWRRFDWDLQDETTLAALRGLGRMLFVVTQAGAGAQTQTIWVDDLSVQRCVPATAISGVITQRNAASPDLEWATIVLTRSDSAGTQVLLRTRPDAAGSYRFDGLPSLPSGAAFQVWFLNAPAGPQRDDTAIEFWAGPRFTGVSDGAQLTAATFDISDLPLLSPPSYAEVVATNTSPARLSWQARGNTGERYQLCLYDPQLLDPATGLPAQVCSAQLDPARNQMAFDLSPASFEAAPLFNFRYGRSYRWYVVASGPSGQTGSSFYERAITPVAAPAQAPSDAVTPDPEPPAPGAANASWTVLVYAAGDNALGDARRAPGTARVDVQLAALASLAPRYPQINLVSYADRYGDTGTQLCYLRPAGGPDCQARAEANSASAANLSGVLAEVRARYPADRTMLALLGPGHALGGFGSDETTPGAPSLSAADLGVAIQGGLGAGERLDLVLIQAPLMGSLEVASALAPAANYLVAASDQLWQVPLLTRLPPLLAGANGGQPVVVAQGLVNAYNTAVQAQVPGRMRSIAAYDLAQAPLAAAALDSLGAALLTQLTQDEAAARALLAEARSLIQFYDSSANGMLNRIAGPAQPIAAAEDALADLTELTAAIATSPLADTPVQEAAQELLDVLAGATPLVIGKIQVSGIGLAGLRVDLTDASGVAVFLPADRRLGHQATMAQLMLYSPGATGGWAELLRAYLGGAPLSGPGGVTAGPAGGARLAPPAGGLIDWDLGLPIVGQ